MSTGAICSAPQVGGSVSGVRTLQVHRSVSGHLVNLVVLTLPLRRIVTLYLHVLAALLLYMGHQISK